MYELWCFCILCSRFHFITTKIELLKIIFIDNFFGEYKEISHLTILQDPTLQDLESNFIIHQKLVEAAKKLASEPDLCKNVKKKRKQEYADAVKKLQEIENSINEYRIKCGKKPTQKSALALPGERIPHVLMQTGGKKSNLAYLETLFTSSLYGFYLLQGS